MGRSLRRPDSGTWRSGGSDQECTAYTAKGYLTRGQNCGAASLADAQRITLHSSEWLLSQARRSTVPVAASPGRRRRRTSLGRAESARGPAHYLACLADPFARAGLGVRTANSNSIFSGILPPTYGFCSPCRCPSSRKSGLTRGSGYWLPTL